MDLQALFIALSNVDMYRLVMFANNLRTPVARELLQRLELSAMGSGSLEQPMSKIECQLEDILNNADWMQYREGFDTHIQGFRFILAPHSLDAILGGSVGVLLTMNGIEVASRPLNIRLAALFEDLAVKRGMA